MEDIFNTITECVIKSGDVTLLGELSSEFVDKVAENSNRPWWQNIRTLNGVHKFDFTETCAKTGMVMLLGEISSSAQVNLQQVVRDTIKHIGYDDSNKGKQSHSVSLVCCLSVFKFVGYTGLLVPVISVHFCVKSH